MIEVTIEGLLGVIQKGGGVGVYRKGDRVEGTKENEEYHVSKGHAVYVGQAEKNIAAEAVPAGGVESEKKTGRRKKA